jgi:MerR family transcriptional regulator, light-induced transcriptional regulator
VKGPGPVIGLRAAADELGVHYQTAYGWVREGILPARKSGRGYQVLEADVRELGARRAAGKPPRREVRVRDWDAQADLLYGAIVSGHDGYARAQLGRLGAGVPVIDLCARVLGPALSRIGDDWAAGTVTIAMEHRATAICERLIGTLSAGQPRGRPRGVAVTGTPSGERHGLPALMAAACLREDRWHVHHLGADLPPGEVGRLARDVGARLVVLSSATPESARRASKQAAGLISETPGLRVLAGGPGSSLYQLVKLARTAHRS